MRGEERASRAISVSEKRDGERWREERGEKVDASACFGD